MKPISLYNKKDTLADKYNEISINNLPKFEPQNINKNFRSMQASTNHSHYTKTNLLRTADRLKVINRYQALGTVQDQLNKIKQQVSKLSSPLTDFRQANSNCVSNNRIENIIIKPQCVRQQYTQQYSLKAADNNTESKFLTWNKGQLTKIVLKQNQTPLDQNNDKDPNMKNIRNQILDFHTPNSRLQYQFENSRQNELFRERTSKQDNQLVNKLTCENKKLKGQLQSEICSHKYDKIRLQQYQSKIQTLQNACKSYQNKLKQIQDNDSKRKQQVYSLRQKIEVKDSQLSEFERKVKQLDNQLKNRAIFYIYTLNNKQLQRKALQQSILSKPIAINIQQTTTFQLQSKIEQLNQKLKNQKAYFQIEIQQLNKKIKAQAQEFQSKTQQLRQRLKIQNSQFQFRIQHLKQKNTSKLLQLIKVQQQLTRKQQKVENQGKQLAEAHQRQKNLLSRVEQMTIKVNQLQDQLKLKSPVLYKNCSQSPIQSTQDKQIGIMNQKINKLESEAKADKKIIKSLKKQVEMMRSDLEFLQETKHTVSYLHFLNEELNQRLVITHMSQLELKYKRESENQQK